MTEISVIDNLYSCLAIFSKMPLIMANKFFRGVNLANFTCCLHLGVADSSSKVEELEDKVSQLEAARDELEVSVEKLTKEKEALEEKVSEQEQNNNELTEKNAELTEKVAELEKEVEELRNELDEIGDGAPVATSFSSDGVDVEVRKKLLQFHRDVVYWS